MRRWAAAAAGLALVLSGGSAQARQPFFWGAGGRTCADWTRARQTQDHMTAAMRGWVLGMVSAYNMRRDPGEAGVTPGGDVLDNAGPEELLGGVNNYCGDNPGDPVWKAVYFVLREFDERNAAALAAKAAAAAQAAAPAPAADVPSPAPAPDAPIGDAPVSPPPPSL